MLHVPAHTKPTFTIVGLDPGTHNLGLGALHVDMLTYQIQSYEAYTLVATKLVREDSLLSLTHGWPYARVEALGDEIVRHLKFLRPSAVACEDAYFSRKFPGAFSPLLMSINGIRQAVIQYNRFLPFTLIEPSVIKQAVGAKSEKRKKGDRRATVNKVPVLEAIQATPEFNVPTKTPLHTLSEHAIDSLAIAYARLKQMRS